MKQLYIKQKVFSLSGKFTIKNELEEDVYYVEGSFMQIPKTFSIMNTTRDEVALITKKVFSFLPKFFVEVNGLEVLTIKKEFSFFKARYTIDGADIEVHGNWWDMNFQILQHGIPIHRIYNNRICQGLLYIRSYPKPEDILCRIQSNLRQE